MNELEKKIIEFEKVFLGKDIEICFDNFLIGKINFYNTDIQYDKESGYLKLLSQKDNENNSFEFNSLDINNINYNSEKFEINLDNSQIIKIVKK